MSNPSDTKGRIEAVVGWIPQGACLGQFQPDSILRELPSLVLAGILILVAGCASNNHGAAETPRPGSGAEEYRKLVTDSEAAVLHAMHWLDQVALQTNACPAKLMSRFSREVERLQSESFRVRARARAIQARGDAYFDSWAEQGVSADSAKTVESLHALQDSFHKIKLTSQQTGDAFKPFLAGLRKLRAQLETDPSTVQKDETRDLIRRTRESGSRTVESLRGVSAELSVLTRLLVPAKSVDNL